ncbi:hypothetical protein NPIL_236041 [Nephila pilipes]|uniref:Uncharacterized protein n=1 Tax=Nephila pilipes TaxID=299642 RepID=A0A8X6TBF1_NEPPI|nr:hypothetical protein NPIL_236041 [Nephila pilipes]
MASHLPSQQAGNGMRSSSGSEGAGRRCISLEAACNAATAGWHFASYRGCFGQMALQAALKATLGIKVSSKADECLRDVSRNRAESMILHAFGINIQQKRGE